MDEHYLNTLRQNIIIALKRAEASLLNDQPLDLDEVMGHVQIFQNYVTKHMPEAPSDTLKHLVHDVFFDIQRLSDQITDEAQLSKMRLAEMSQSQKVIRGYNYGSIKQ